MRRFVYGSRQVVGAAVEVRTVLVLAICRKVDVFDEHASSLEDTCEASMVPISALDSMPDSLESGAATAGLSAERHREPPGYRSLGLGPRPIGA